MTTIDPEDLINSWCAEMNRLAPEDRFAKSVSEYPDDVRRMMVAAMASALASLGFAP